MLSLHQDNCILSLARIVPGIWHQGEIAGSFDGSLYQVLLLPTGACASGGFDLTRGANESDQHVEAFVVDFPNFELLDLFTTVVAIISDGGCLPVSKTICCGNKSS